MKWPRVPAERCVSRWRRSPASRASCCGLTCGQPLAIAASNRSTAVGGRIGPACFTPKTKKPRRLFGTPRRFLEPCHPVQVTIDPISEQMAVPWRVSACSPTVGEESGQPVAQAASLTAGRPCSASSSSSGCTPIWLANVVEVRGRDRRFARSRVVSWPPRRLASGLRRLAVCRGRGGGWRPQHELGALLTARPRPCTPEAALVQRHVGEGLFPVRLRSCRPSRFVGGAGRRGAPPGP